MWSYLKNSLQVAIVVVVEGESLLKKQYRELLKIHKQIGIIKEKM